MAFCAASLVHATAAQDAASLSSNAGGVYIPAEGLERSAPNYPIRALQQYREGWAIVSFIISEQGTVIEPMIEESSHPDFDGPTLRAVEKWRYKPATLDGSPVEESAVRTAIRFKIEDADGAGERFIDSYRSIHRSIAANELAEASSKLLTLESGRLNYYEQAWLSWLKYVYLDATGTAPPSELIATLRRAVGALDDEGYLEPDVFVTALQRLVLLSARDGDLSGALIAFARLRTSEEAQRSKLYDDTVASLEPLRQQIVGIVKGPRVLQQTGRIGTNDYWVHRMLRRSFAWGDVDGKLRVIDLRCTRANRRFAPTLEGSVLKVPESWGECSVYVKGDVDTTFVFEEYPSEQADVAEPSAAALETP
jgi:TonB family protein